MKYEVRKLDDSTPPLIVESDDPDHAPDEAGRHVGWTEPGQVVFFEVREAGSPDWVLWRVEGLNQRPFVALLTQRGSLEQAREEIRASREGMS